MVNESKKDSAENGRATGEKLAKTAEGITGARKRTKAAADADVTSNMERDFFFGSLKKFVKKIKK